MRQEPLLGLKCIEKAKALLAHPGAEALLHLGTLKDKATLTASGLPSTLGNVTAINPKLTEMTGYYEN